MSRDLFLKQEWLWPVLIGALILWALFLWKEYRQEPAKWLVLRVFLSFIAVLSLVAMILQPLHEVPYNKAVGVILTQNYKSKQLDSLKDHNRQMTVIEYAEKGLNYAQLDSIKTAYILGDGLETYDLWQLDNMLTTYLPGKNSGGIQRIKYNQKIQVGDSLSIQGLYRKPEMGTNIFLQDPSGNKLDSVVLKTQEDAIFKVKATSKAIGSFEYKLVVKDSLHQTLSADVIPVVVVAQRHLRILILNTFPSFETKYLKNYLSEKGHEVLVRSQISKNKYKFENYNRPQDAIYNLTMDNLKKFDLIIMDGNSYLSLSNSSKKALNNRVETHGLGIFIQPDAGVLNRGDRFGFRLKRNNKKSTQLSRWPKIPIPMAMYDFEQGLEMSPILIGENTVLSAYYQNGFGRVGTSLALETYPLILKGHDEVYAFIWSQILEGVSQRSIPLAHWETQGEPIYVDEPYNFKLKTSIKEPIVLNSLQNRVSLRQNLYLPEQWEGVVYPLQSGWHQLQLEQDSTEVVQYYIYPKNNWQGLRRYIKQQTNERYFTSTTTDVAIKNELEPYTRLWFFILFLMAMGSLWLLPRL